MTTVLLSAMLLDTPWQRSSSFPRQSRATEAAVMIGCGGSSAGVERSLLGATRECEGDARFEEVRRRAGDLGGVDPPALCNELNDGLLCMVGVFDCSPLLNELELGVLRRGLFCK